MPDPRIIPSIEQLLQRTRVQELETRYGRDTTIAVLRQEAARLRDQLTGSSATTPMTIKDADQASAHLEETAQAQLARTFEPSLRTVINATGVIVHTNLGRAPLAASAVRRIADTAGKYVNLEYDLERGRRGTRDSHADAMLRRLTGADAAVVVNNNAAAVLLLLATVAAGREVVASRGELIEIGGGFRVPEIMAQSGAVLREVGTTNKTRAADYAAAVSDRTALLLRVHPSNFRMEGFTERPRLEELVALSRRAGVPVAEDLGSGNVVDTSAAAARSATPPIAEPTVQASVQAGTDLVTFSGDKLLGGPQAGIVVGRQNWIDQMRGHPLMRAVRVDKIVYAALEATLGEYASGRARRTIPVARMVYDSLDDITRRAQGVANQLAALDVGLDLVDGQSTIGGGSAPGVTIPTRLLRVSSTQRRPDDLEAALRRHDPPIIARIDDDHVVLDLRTVLPEQDSALVEALRVVLGGWRGRADATGMNSTASGSRI